MTKTISVSLSQQGEHAGNNFDNLYVLDTYIRENTPGKPFERSVVNDGTTQVFAVFDGMGEGELGVEAARTAAEILDVHRKMLLEQPDIPFKTFVRDFLKEANEAICNRIRAHKGLRMGTTFSLLYLHDGIARIANIGNSRIFLHRGESLIQLTYDHTQAQKLVRMGIIGREETREHPEKNVLTQYLGIFPEEMTLEPSFGPTVILQKKDTFLISSNGLTDSLEEPALRERLSAPGVFSDLPHRMVQAATDAGSRDNLSLIAVRIMDTDTAQAVIAAGALIDMTTQIPAGEIDREAAAAIDLMDVGSPAPPVKPALPAGRMSPVPRSRAWRVLAPILLFVVFIFVGAGTAKLAFSWDDLFNRQTTAATTATTTAKPTTTTVKPTTTTAKPTTHPPTATPVPTTAAPTTTAKPTTVPTTAAPTTTPAATTPAAATTTATSAASITTIATTPVAP
ncbi:MAG TPA: protein phosphatase 2C domain-containing protein [Clostridia bacterium]